MPEANIFHTRGQERAQLAYQRVVSHRDKDHEAKYLRFAKQFPALIHTCGWRRRSCSRKPRDTLADYGRASRGGPCPATTHYRVPQHGHYDLFAACRQALTAASWLKRYAEALLTDKKGGQHASLP